MNDTPTYLPESGDWSCAACGEKLAPAPVGVTYLQGGFTITLMTCAKCGLSLVPEHLAVGKMFEVEQLLEDK